MRERGPQARSRSRGAAAPTGAPFDPWPGLACALALAAELAVAIPAPVQVRAPVVFVFVAFGPGAALSGLGASPGGDLVYRIACALGGSIAIGCGVALTTLYFLGWNPGSAVVSIALATSVICGVRLLLWSRTTRL